MSDRPTLSPEELKLLSQMGEKMAPYRQNVALSLQKVLESTALYHERLFTPEEISQYCTKNAEDFLRAIEKGEMYTEPEAVKERGAEFAYLGLGDRSLVDSVSCWMELCLSLVAQTCNTMQQEQIFVVLTKALGRYASLFTEGYLQATRDKILDAQDEMVTALEQSLRESEQWFSTTLKSIGDGVIATNTKGRITFMNDAAEAVTGWTQPEAAGKPLAEIFHIINEETREQCENPFEKIVKKGKIVGLANNTVLVARDGKEKLIADSGAPIRDENNNFLGTVLVFRDVTEKRKMEEGILKVKTEKMESISILAGGIAHDFNNILTAVLGNITIAKMYTVSNPKVLRLLTEAEKASLAAKSLTQQLLTFSKGGAPVRKPVSIPELLKDTAEFALSGSKTGCTFSMEEDLWLVEIDAGQISQVMNNLLINADQAMPAGGIITVRAENVVVRGKEGLPLKNGDYVRISVEDEGIGIPESHLQRIFEPYFTTKQKGSGLGLATSYSIIKNHGGCITVESELGRGTTFHVYLPAFMGGLEVEEKELNTPVGGKERVLLMDDDESVLEVTSEVLSFLGYGVEVARDGEEALERYTKATERGEPFDVVIVDLTIRGKMGGKETIQNLLQIDPGVKAVVSSGYSDDPVMANFREYGFKGVVAKPYTIEELSETLKRVIEGS